MRASLAMLFALWAAPAGAAMPWHEGFDTALNGWTNAGAPVWRATNGYAQVNLPASPLPQSVALLTTGALAGAAFTGDYATADLGVIGFRFQALQVPPSGLTLTWLRGTNGFFRNLQHLAPATGVWYTIYCSLADRDTGGWSGDAAELFDYVRSSVDTVSLSVLAPATAAGATFRIDDLRVDHLHRATGLHRNGEGDIVVQWERLQTNLVYRLEQAASPQEAWSAPADVPATNSFLSVACTAATVQAVWRLVLP